MIFIFSIAAADSSGFTAIDHEENVLILFPPFIVSISRLQL